MYNVNHSISLVEFIHALKGHPDFEGCVVHHHHLPPVSPRYKDLPWLSSLTLRVLEKLGIQSLYSHQAEAIDYLRQGKNVVIATPTASGKSLIYNIVVFEEIMNKKSARALYLFPLKALEQDQMKNLAPWLTANPQNPLTADIYDGDTTPYRRKKIRSQLPHILFSNPDMLHRSILPYHGQWEQLFANLGHVILDEVHTYRGIFGSHVNQILRRLKRLCHKYGSRPRFVLLSATISNPGQFASQLIEEDVQVVTDSGSPRAGQHFIFMNPDLSANFSAAKLFLFCIQNGFRTIAFTQSRKVTELIHLWISQLSPQMRKKISSYRAGFMPRERREIERKLATGQLLGVVSTSALEMGIDIGYLDICILVGYPGTIINTWQRGGRVGRAGQESLIILVAKPDALDQYFMKHPEDLFDRSFEAAILDPANPYVIDSHLPCAAAEQPLTLQDKAFWGETLESRLEALEQEGALLRTAEGEPVWFSRKRNPHRDVDIRSTGDTFTIFEKGTGQAIGTIDGVRAFKECHPGAVYLHMARQYQVCELLVDKKDIIVERARLNYFTRALGEKETEILQITRTKPECQFIVREGHLKVTERITSYEKRALPGQELMGVFPLDLPPQTFETTGFWIEIEPEIKAFIEREGHHFMGSIHAVEHAAIGIFPLFALCDRSDVGGISHPHHPQVGKSAIFIYDGYPGGVGLARRGFEVISELLQKTLEIIKGCECEEGCPSCIHSPKCGSGNKPLDKGGAVKLLEALLGNIPLNQIATHPKPQGEEDLAQGGSEPEVKAGPRIIFMDLETQKSADEVGGWHKAHLMRVSIAVTYDSASNEFQTFAEDRIGDLFDLLGKADLIVGFNIKRFDYNVLKAYITTDLAALPTFDILEDIKSRLGFRLSLDHLARETLGRNKTAHGLQAIEWFRSGEMEKLHEYCKQDVIITRDLFLYGVSNGHLIYRQKDGGHRLRLLVDWDVDKIFAKAKENTAKER